MFGNKIIYRVECKKGIGPYSYEYATQWRKDFDKQRNPAPHDDFNILKSIYWSMNKYEFNFGFESIESLHKWFTVEEQSDLEKLGFYVVKVIVNRSLFCCTTLKSQKQIAYRKKDVINKEKYSKLVND